MPRIAALVCALLVVPVFLAGQSQEPTFPAPAVGASTTALEQVLRDYWEWRLAESPELATRMGRRDYNDRWTDWSKAARTQARMKREEFLRQAQYIGTGNLTLANRLNVELLEYELRTRLDSQAWSELTSRTSQSDGAHNEVFSTIDQMPSRDAKDYENIIARLRALPVYVDQTIELLREQLAAGLAQPAITVDLTLDQIVAQRSAAPLESPLMIAFRRFPEGVAAADQQRLTAQAVAAYEQQFVPSWRKLEAFLRDTYRPKARPSIALSSVPRGRDGYAALIHSNTTTRMTPEQIHQIGLKEVARLEQEMLQIARAEGFMGTLAEYEAALLKRPGMMFTSKDEMVAYARDVMRRVEPSLPKLFSRMPRMKVDVRPIPPDREASAASSYTAGTADGSRPAWFNLNTYRPSGQPKYRTEALVLHEVMPGHHLQVALERETPGLPEFRRAFTAAAFSEGWALYAESLGPELGTVYRDPTTKFGQLASERFRAVRLVVDTGIHALGWTRDQAREYFKLNAPSQSLAEVDRYIARPAQALAYKLGEITIRELRTRAERELGVRFDIREFHDVVLRSGRVPLEVLEEQVAGYIASAKSR